ncbi:NTP transferase domain-containing protein [Bacillus sp. RAR_GA_16]|uniref:NTP transferase domain-containing protein n=1 Tax=Bacillus sp. RAR_GA_16 TaxID=2876774 RepID=UPI001CC90ACC|nr:NTP transferase domain-containing protein [Bacillus sp. RAR_GA_16]MCA0171459.1 NTP transferase domain-containing protein [Bacillus sp. RAR_GA_16]
MIMSTVVIDSLLPHHSELLIQFQIREMRKIVDEIIVVTNTPRELLPYVPAETRVITDFFQSKGPLGGLHAGLSLSRTEVAWVIESDNLAPSTCMASRLIKSLLKLDVDAVLPTINGVLKPFEGVYRTSVKAHLTDFLKQEEACASSFLENINTSSVVIKPDRLFLK